VSARANIAGALSAAVVVAMAWVLGTSTHSAGSTTATTTNTPTAGSSSTSSPSAGGATVSGTFVGTSVSTRYGSVQVKIVVAAGKITNVIPVRLTDQGGRSVQLSNRAAPILRTEVLKAQSAKVKSVSGATYTTDAYLQSLQAAIDKAGI
jgi:uncharacterized protein with FMN-binding domain